MSEISHIIKKYISEDIKYEYIDKSDIDYIDISHVNIADIKKQYILFAQHYIAPEYGDKLYFLRKYNILKEGVNQTVPVNGVKFIIMNQYNLQDWQVIIKKRNRVEFIIIIPDKGNNEDMITEDMISLGYFVARKWYQTDSKTKSKYLYIKFDPKFQKDETNNIRNGRYLYHVSPKCNHDSILKNGFIPSSKNNFLSYPDRVYFFRVCIMPADLKDIITQIDQFKYDIKEHDYVIYLIDLFKVDSDILFYNDCNYEYGVFTEDPITADSIISYKGVNINDDIKEWYVKINKIDNINHML